jgi:hypothetical protein
MQSHGIHEHLKDNLQFETLVLNNEHFFISTTLLFQAGYCFTIELLCTCSTLLFWHAVVLSCCVCKKKPHILSFYSWNLFLFFYFYLLLFPSTARKKCSLFNTKVSNWARGIFRLQTSEFITCLFPYLPWYNASPHIDLWLKPRGRYGSIEMISGQILG